MSHAPYAVSHAPYAMRHAVLRYATLRYATLRYAMPPGEVRSCVWKPLGSQASTRTRAAYPRSPGRHLEVGVRPPSAMVPAPRAFLSARRASHPPKWKACKNNTISYLDVEIRHRILFASSLVLKVFLALGPGPFGRDGARRADGPQPLGGFDTKRSEDIKSGNLLVVVSSFA